MQPWEILILKPTRVFLSFVAAQLPTIELPRLRQLQEDCTAYVIKKHNNDEDTFNEIERHFAMMFRHEICRLFGENAHNKIEGSFLDFLCCFKFELHSQVLVQEPIFVNSCQLLRVKPRSVLLKWLKSTVEEDDGARDVIDRINLCHIAENATVIVKNFTNLENVKSFVKHNYETIFAAEMKRMCDRAEEWPTIDSIQAFNRYFTIKFHSQLVHLC